MSLVNDMLRDLENRRAGPDERVPLVGLHAVDEAAARRRERIERLRRGSIWFAAVMLIALLVGMMIGSDANHWTVAQCEANMRAARDKWSGIGGGLLWESSNSETAAWAARVGQVLGL